MAQRPTQQVTLAQAVEQLVEVGVNIADMTRTANRIGERDNWQGELYDAISADIRRWQRRRSRLVTRVQAMRRAAQAA
jgi:hypothetical protein